MAKNTPVGPVAMAREYPEPARDLECEAQA